MEDLLNNGGGDETARLFEHERHAVPKADPSVVADVAHEGRKVFAYVISGGLVLATTLAFNNLTLKIIREVSGERDQVLAYTVYFLLMFCLTVVVIYLLARLGGRDVRKIVEGTIGAGGT